MALLAVTDLFIVLSFRLILPVSPRRRLLGWRTRSRGTCSAPCGRGRVREQTTAQSLQYDRLSQAALWLGTQTPVRPGRAAPGSMSSPSWRLRWTGPGRRWTPPCAPPPAWANRSPPRAPA
ncbi:MAG: hypothetical protein WDN49_13025 [Acetobacteraceae bacterium]